MLISNYEFSYGHKAPYIVAEIGGNHNGSLAKALALIDMAKKAGADAVKFQKRNSDISVPEHEKDAKRNTPWGHISYIEYRYKMEFGKDEYDSIDEHCKRIGMDWFVSVWDADSVAFMEQYDPIAYKIGSACITDTDLLDAVRESNRPVIMSTGMSWPDEILEATKRLAQKEIVLCKTTSAYPTEFKEVQLRSMNLLRGYNGEPASVFMGYSGHERGWIPTLGAVALGAAYVERHFTDDKAQWGSDQSISLEPQEFSQMVSDIMDIHASLGAGAMGVFESELRAMRKLRKHPGKVHPTTAFAEKVPYGQKS